jgi:hypothetical protein
MVQLKVAEILQNKNIRTRDSLLAAHSLLTIRKALSRSLEGTLLIQLAALPLRMARGPSHITPTIHLSKAFMDFLSTGPVPLKPIIWELFHRGGKAEITAAE